MTSRFLFSFLTVFVNKGMCYRFFSLIHSFCMLFYSPSININFYNTLHLSLKSFVLSLVSRIKILFYFFYGKTNKKLYKYSRYKLPKYYLRYFFIKPKNRTKKLLFVIRKSFLLFGKANLFFHRNLFNYYKSILTAPRHWVGYNLIMKIHKYVFKSYRMRLFFNGKSA